MHHAIVWADPDKDHSWVSPLKRPKTDGIHAKGRRACVCRVCRVRLLMSSLPDSHPTTKTVATNELHYSQAVKLLKV